MTSLTAAERRATVTALRDWLATYADAESAARKLKQEETNV